MNAEIKGGRSDHHASTGSSSTDAGDTVAAEDLSSSGSAPSGAKHAKVCCVCGANLAGEKRYKDSEGRYWCCDCAKADTDKKTPAVCPDCNQQLTAGDLTDFEGQKLCHACIGKRQHAAKRAAQRKAAAEEEARVQQKQHRMVLIASGVAAALMVGYAVFRVLR
ncbi:MAG: hypothetical protein ABSH20_16310 [Tepidisphaeraceae bacterium]|jgi:hypothetical protein